MLDGESEYPLLAVRSTKEPLTYERWMQKFIEFSWSTSGQEPWSEERIRDLLEGECDELEVYGGQRIYRYFQLEEISREDFDILRKYL